MLIFTIGHSTRSLDEFLALLGRNGVKRLADVRTVPKSRRHPHFAGDQLAMSLPAAGVAYRHFKALGGLRKPSAESTNGGWRHPAFRGYADYMGTAAFDSALDALLGFAAGGDGRDTVVMCAEAVWWRCHRQLIADALVARGVTVRHILSAAPAEPHALTSFARVLGERVTYPSPLGL